MIHLDIKTNDNYISVYDIGNPLRCYNFYKREEMTEHSIFRLFMDLAVKSWMNPRTLIAFKEEIIKEYPDVIANWGAIFSAVERQFEDRELQSFHTNGKVFMGSYT